MPAPCQRSDAALQRREIRDREEDVERERQCAELREESIAKAQHAEQQRQQQRDKSRRLFEARQAELAQAGRREQAESLDARRRTLGEIELKAQARAKKAAKERLKKIEAAHEAGGMFAAQQQKIEDERQLTVDMRRKQALIFERRILEKREEAANFARVAAEADAKEGERIRAMRSSIRAKQRRDKELQDAGDRYLRDSMVDEAKSNVEYQRQHERARSRAADTKKAELNEHLERDHRVPRWQALGWHVKEDNTEWRWPFSLDWSWVERGERVLNDERFVGLTLPPDFVAPSERIALRERAVRGRATREKRSGIAILHSARRRSDAAGQTAAVRI